MNIKYAHTIKHRFPNNVKIKAGVSIPSKNPVEGMNPKGPSLKNFVMAKPAETNDNPYEIANFVGISTQAGFFGSAVPPDNSIKVLTSSKFPVNFPQEEKKIMVYNII